MAHRRIEADGKTMTGGHRRNTGPMLSSPRCGAMTRSGRPCRSPAVRGKRRCRMHGGAAGSGAPLRFGVSSAHTGSSKGRA
ncbi:MAG: HGGxSTG domain-containing protein [Xanthobacteraceae bacterium]